MAKDQKRTLKFEDLRDKGWGYSREYTHRLMLAGKFPKPFKAHASGRINFWLESDIDRFMADRAKSAQQ